MSQAPGPERRSRGGEWRMLATASSIGLAMVVSILLGLFLGLWLDRRLDTRPWLTLAGLAVGVAAGFRNLWVMSARIERGLKEDSHDR